MSTNEKNAERAGKILGITAIVIIVCVVLGFLSLLLFGDNILKWIINSLPDGDYTEFTPALTRSLKSSYGLDIPDSAILDEGKYYVTTWQSTDRRVVRIVFRIDREDVDGMFVGNAWKRKDGEFWTYAFTDGKNTASLYVRDCPGYSKERVICTLIDEGKAKGDPLS